MRTLDSRECPSKRGISLVEGRHTYGNLAASGVQSRWSNHSTNAVRETAGLSRSHLNRGQRAGFGPSVRLILTLN